MRDAFVNALMALARADKRIWLLTGDLGYSVLEKFRDEFPDRYINAGVAEQNMTGIACGLAMSGKIPFTYSIANFPTLRCLEQIRNDVAYHRANVKIVSVGGGYAYGAHGYTHHGVEDYGILSLLPNMKVIAPADPVETTLATELIAGYDGPCYLRLGRAKEPILHKSEKFSMKMGEPLKVRDGRDSVLLATGGGLSVALAAADRLALDKHEAEVWSVPFLVPFANDFVLDLIKQGRGIVTVEEHGPGGLGTKVSEVVATSGHPVRFRIVRLAHQVANVSGDRDFLREKQGLSPAVVYEAAMSVRAGSYR
ncbi:MAG TPA: transketolase C-terminal domain-containing protein [Planktothrix sp.]|jgi:transketolase